MSRIIADLFSNIQLDPWRTKVDFSADLEYANEQIRIAVDNEEAIIDALKNWLQKYQPCLFGRLAAKQNQISFCVLTETDLNNDDQFIQDKIQAARTKWTRDGFVGKKSGFILFACSPKLANSLPNSSLMSFAKELCSQYLLSEIKEDIIYTDDMFLEIPGNDRVTLRWNAGVNYFCANGDKRWWQDHRIPGGLAFSVNSVGHMAKTGGIAAEIDVLNKSEQINEGEYVKSNIDSLGQALEFAMRTIHKASDAVSGKATELVSTSETKAKAICPINLPKTLEGKDCREYRGFYHTDITIPSEYFLAEIERPDGCKPQKLDFTYIYERNIQNPDHIKMGLGQRIRGKKSKLEYTPNPKMSKNFPEEVDIRSSPRLLKAINESK